MLLLDEGHIKQNCAVKRKFIGNIKIKFQKPKLKIKSKFRYEIEKALNLFQIFEF